MTSKQMLASLAACAVLVFLGLFALDSARAEPPSLPAGPWLNRAVEERLSQNEALRDLAPSVLLLGGAQEQNGIFITKSGLVEDIPAGDEEVISANITGIAAGISKAGIPATVMLIPTAAAVKQSELPPDADLYNQKALILSVYSSLTGVAGTADAYAELFGAREQTIYCRTDSALSGLGGYYVYRALATPLGLSAHGLNEFEIENLSFDYRGDLYERSGFRRIRPDLLSLYRYAGSSRVGTMTCWRDGVPFTYATLYPVHLEELGRTGDVLLGGDCAIRDILYSSQRGGDLLIYADDTVRAYLPFLSPHYRRITVIDPRKVSGDLPLSVDPGEYDRVVFACSVKTFSQENIFGSFPS